jgi:acetyl-CoA carboxylase carboxyltransferase component
MSAQKKRETGTAVATEDCFVDEMVSPRERRAELVARAEQLEAENDEAHETQFQEAREVNRLHRERERFSK